MLLDDDACYEVIRGRDRRFEGRFVVGVRTTGIYCRPGCPAPLPKRPNVRFYPSAAAAEEAGFRPCMRCRPETSPGTPAWAGTSATVARALRLIEGGALDGASSDVLADRLGVGARHLRRLFAEQVGAAPGAVARTRRVHFARTLIDQTDLPLAEIALASGFGSVRRFNGAFRTTFRVAPSALRRPGAVASKGAFELRLPYRAPLAWQPLLRFLAARAIPGVESVTGTSYRRTTGGGIIEVRPVEGAAYLVVRASGSTDLMDRVDRVMRLFDLDADPSAIAAHLGADARLAPLIARHPGLRVPGAWDGFELGVRAILGQQISVARATVLAGKIVAAFGAPLGEAAAGDLTHQFPSAPVLASAAVEQLGMPGARAASIRAFAAAVAGGALRLDASRGLDDAIARLKALPGIGPWTAHYIAMRALREPDAFPAGDLVLRRAWTRQGGSALEEDAERWRPWRAYAAMALWTDEAAAARETTRGRAPVAAGEAAP